MGDGINDGFKAGMSIREHGHGNLAARPAGVMLGWRTGCLHHGEAAKRDGTLLPLSKGDEDLSRRERALIKVEYNPWGSVAELQKRVQTWLDLLDLSAKYKKQKGKNLGAALGLIWTAAAMWYQMLLGQKKEFGKCGIFVSNIV